MCLQRRPARRRNPICRPLSCFGIIAPRACSSTHVAVMILLNRYSYLSTASPSSISPISVDFPLFQRPTCAREFRRLGLTEPTGCVFLIEAIFLTQPLFSSGRNVMNRPTKRSGLCVVVQVKRSPYMATRLMARRPSTNCPPSAFSITGEIAQVRAVAVYGGWAPACFTGSWTN